MRSYFFVLGNNPSLSWAELQSLFPAGRWLRYDSVAVAELDDFNARDLIAVLGGTIKIGEVVNDFNLANRSALAAVIKKTIIASAQKESWSGKYNFGFSSYHRKIPGDFFKLGLAVKKELKALNIPSRLVTSKDQILSSVIVEQNKLISSGLEICLFGSPSRVLVGRTLAVQPFKDLAKRDFGRPSRDDFSGLIPPKLAQIMLNLARADDKDFSSRGFLDPFCGSGTILMEAALMGFKNIIGSDLSDRAVLDSRKNMAWVKETISNNQADFNLDIFQSDVLKLKDRLEDNSLDYIVGEPYLGPARGFNDLGRIKAELEELYTQALSVLLKLLTKRGRIVMVWPQFKTVRQTWAVIPATDGFDFKSAGLYGRSGQKVWRDIVVLSKK